MRLTRHLPCDVAIYCACAACRRAERAGQWWLAGIAVLLIALGFVAGTAVTAHLIFSSLP